MQTITHIIEDDKIAELLSDDILINSIEEGSDLLATVYYQGFDKVILYAHNFRADFFDLQNGMAGEVLQKFSNFRVRLVIVGDFAQVEKKSLRDFILESNNGKQVNFVASLSKGIDALSK